MPCPSCPARGGEWALPARFGSHPCPAQCRGCGQVGWSRWWDREAHHGGLKLQRDGTQSVLQQPLPGDVQDQRLGGLGQLADVPPQDLRGEKQREGAAGWGLPPARPEVLEPGVLEPGTCPVPAQLPSLPFTCPSVEAEKHSVPVLDCSQTAPYTGSLWLTSTVDTSTGSPPFLVSQ